MRDRKMLLFQLIRDDGLNILLPSLPPSLFSAIQSNETSLMIYSKTSSWRTRPDRFIRLVLEKKGGGQRVVVFIIIIRS